MAAAGRDDASSVTVMRRATTVPPHGRTRLPGVVERRVRGGGATAGVRRPARRQDGGRQGQRVDRRQAEEHGRDHPGDKDGQQAAGESRQQPRDRTARHHAEDSARCGAQHAARMGRKPGGVSYTGRAASAQQVSVELLQPFIAICAPPRHSGTDSDALKDNGSEKVRRRALCDLVRIRSRPQGRYLGHGGSHVTGQARPLQHRLLIRTGCLYLRCGWLRAHARQCSMNGASLDQKKSMLGSQFISPEISARAATAL